MTATILVIDDSLTVRKILEIGLLREGFKVVCFDSGIEAVETLRKLAKQASEELPDLIILDVIMPGIDGYRVALRLKSHPILQTIPVILLTRLAGVIDRLKGRLAGAATSITKPFRITEVIAEVEAHRALQRNVSLDCQPIEK